MRRSIVLVALISLANLNIVLGQKDSVNVDIFFDMSFEDLLKVEVTSASKTAQKIADAPNVVSLINQSQIQEYGWISINEIATKLPGFSYSQDYDRPTLSNRGLFEGWNNNHFLVLVDGVPMNDNLYGTAYTWEITPLVFTKSLEVVRGPGSALYGTNATNGLININTVDPKDLKGVVESRARIGSHGTKIYDAVAGVENNLVSMVLAFNAYETDGNEYLSFDDRKDIDGNYLTTQRKVRDTRSSNYVFAKIEGKGKLSALSLQFHEQHWAFDTGHGWLFQIPDQPESMNEFRRLISARYAPQNAASDVNYEFMMRYQKHSIDWDMRYYPNNALGGFYPNGVTEYLKTDADDIISRAQLNYEMDDGASLLAGVEYTLFLYNGDDAHVSNVDFETAGIPPTAGNEFTHDDPWFEFALDKPVHTVGLFGQYISPKIWNRLQATVGGRFDSRFFEFIDVNDDNEEKDKSFSQFSPRLCLVFFISDDLTLKGMGGRAFRTPAPTEMFGANTFSLNSNINQLEPEVITTYEVAADWKLNKNLNLRVNGYYLDFESQIAYSVARANLSTNVFSLTSLGVESELLYNFNDLSGFLNYSFVTREGENIIDNTINESKGLTWIPQHTANLGIVYTHDKFYLSGVIHYQGEVKRRDSDITAETAAFRPESVDSWSEIDFKLAYTPTPKIDLGVVVKNLFDSENYLIKNNAYTFDYRRPERTILFDVKFSF